MVYYWHKTLTGHFGILQVQTFHLTFSCIINYFDIIYSFYVYFVKYLQYLQYFHLNVYIFQLCIKCLLYSNLIEVVVLLSFGRWIHKYLCNHCLSPLSCEFESHSAWGVLDTTLCDKVCQWLAADLWFSLVSSTNKAERHYKTEILLNVTFNTITLTLTQIE